MQRHLLINGVDYTPYIVGFQVVLANLTLPLCTNITVIAMVLVEIVTKRGCFEIFRGYLCSIYCIFMQRWEGCVWMVFSKVWFDYGCFVQIFCPLFLCGKKKWQKEAIGGGHIASLADLKVVPS